MLESTQLVNRLLNPWRAMVALALLALPLTALGESPTPPADSPPAIRQAFLKVIDRPRVPAEVKEAEVAEAGDPSLIRFAFSYASDAGHRVPGVMFRPKDTTIAKRPVVIALHGTGSNKESMLSLLKTLAGKGFIAVAIDGRYHGERKVDGDYNQAIARAFKEGGEHPLYFDTIWDVMRLMDVLQARPDVDGSRIGLIGFSKGGIETWLLSAVDERVAVSIPCISVQSFKYGLESEGWKTRVGTVKKGFDTAAAEAGIAKPDAAFARKFYDKVLPGIYQQFDGPSMLPLIAPRPLLVINGEKDSLNPLPGMKLSTDAATAAYEKAGVPEKFRFIIQKDAGHTVTTESKQIAVEWFVKWLSPKDSKN